MLQSMMKSHSSSGTRHRLAKTGPLASLAALTLISWPSVSRGQAIGAEQPQSADVRRYCTNIAVAASDARFAYETGKLGELETRIKTRIAELDAKAAELRGWIERRETIEKKASEKLVGIYSKMRPETAATQIAMLDDDMAAAVLAQLTPRQASAIFNEIVPERAGKLAGMIAGVAPAADKKL